MKMHRFMSVRKLHPKNVSVTSGQSTMLNSRTCTLCNRIPSHASFAGKMGIRVHSTWLSPEPSLTFQINKKKRYKLSNVAPSRSGGASKRKMRITVLDTKDSTEAVDSRSFLMSSLSSPAFARPEIMNMGVTIMLPPNSSKKITDKVLKLTSTSNEDSATIFTDQCTTQQVLPLSYSAAELILKGLSSNRFLVHNNSLDEVPRIRNLKKPVFPGPIQSLDLPQLKVKEELEEITVKKIEKPSKSTKRGCQKVGLLENEVKKAIVPISKKEKEGPDGIAVIRANITKQKRLLRRAAYVDVCLSSGRYKHAIRYATCGFKLFPNVPMRSILLEPLISHATQEANFNAVFHSISLAEQFNVPLSMSCYAMCFEMLGRFKSAEVNTGMVKTLLKKMNEEKVGIADVLSCCQNRPVLVERVLRAIRSVDDDVPPNSYSCDQIPPRQYEIEGKSNSYHTPAPPGVITAETAATLVNEQMAAHNHHSFKVKNIACTLSDSEIKNLLEVQKKIENEWRESVAAGFMRNLQTIKKDKSFYQLSTFLDAIPVETFVNMILKEVHNRIDDSGRQSIGFVFAQQSLGERAKEFYDLEILERFGILKTARKAHIEYCKWYANPEKYPAGPSNPREIWENIVTGLQYNDAASIFLLRSWHPEIYRRIGKFLYDILLNDVKINENVGKKDMPCVMVPVLYAVFRKTTKGYQKQLKVHPAVHDIFPNKMQPFLNMNPFELPMVCPPRPWVSPNSGIYPILTPALQRSPESRIGEDALAENIASVPTQQLYTCLDALNQLSSVPWKINNPVLDVVTEVFNSGGCKELTIPSPPSAALQEPPFPYDVSLSDRIKIGRERSLVRQDNASMFSLWCDTLYKLCIAHEFRHRVFWLPHNMDFRGRVYPVCPHLQHMGNDVARSLLIFAKGEKLGPDGLDWLKLHTINLIGNMSKDSLQARLDHANKIMPLILDSAAKPLTGERWWTKSEYPWQTLAACMEIAQAISSGDVENFVSHFPVHQDGSCNGLQHYAALGRDSLGAKSVNLVDTDVPSDVYLSVASRVEEQRARDAAEGNAVAQSLEGFISRKAVKQTVMTTVYGVTRFGAQLQIRGQLKDSGFPLEHVPSAASYVTKLVFQSLGEMFASSRNTQDWLTQCAENIVKVKGMPVKWVTPLGLPVLQPYFKKFSGKLEKKANATDWIDPSYYRLPISMKHRNAFSPNFIHSLDSCHMILTGLHCEQSDITFVSVHDCYWVHAKNVSAMSKLCRQQFVALHSQPILEDLSKFMIKTYCSSDDSCPIYGVEQRRLLRLFSAVPPKGDFCLDEVLKSKYFFS